MAEALSKIERLESDLPACSSRAGGSARASSGRLAVRNGIFRHADPVYRNFSQGRQLDRDCARRLPVRTWRARGEEELRTQQETNQILQGQALQQMVGQKLQQHNLKALFQTGNIYHE